jgi:ADP-ribosylglycohydrolase
MDTHRSYSLASGSSCCAIEVSYQETLALLIYRHSFRATVVHILLPSAILRYGYDPWKSGGESSAAAGISQNKRLIKFTISRYGLRMIRGHPPFVDKMNPMAATNEKVDLLADLLPSSAAELARAMLHERIVGTIFGSALGDAIGLYTEFLPAARSEKEYPTRKFTLLPVATPFCRDFHRSPHLTGEWTDDTDHALLILLSFLHSDGKELEPRDLAARLRVWVEMGLRALDTLPLGLGRTVGSIVRTKTFLDDPHGTAHAHWVKGSFNAAPNGSLMRTHPLGLMCLSKNLPETFEVAARYSVITHVDPRCVVSCMIGTALVRGLVRGDVREEKDVDGIIDEAIEYWGHIDAKLHGEGGPMKAEGEPGLDVAELKKHVVEAQTLTDLQLDDGGKIGYVYKALGSGVVLLRLAMRSMVKTNGQISTQLKIFEDLITGLTMQGGDADTNACVAGSLLGAYLGYKALPPHWRDGLRHGDWLLGKSEALCRVLGVLDGTYSGQDDTDTHPDGGRGFLSHDEIEKRWMLLQARIAKDNHEFVLQQEASAKKRSTKLFGGGGASQWSLLW